MMFSRALSFLQKREVSYGGERRKQVALHSFFIDRELVFLSLKLNHEEREREREKRL